jgi:hypothetical protein
MGISIALIFIKMCNIYIYIYISVFQYTLVIPGDQKVFVLHLMITIQKITCMLKVSQSDWLAPDRQGQGDTRTTLTPSVIPNSNYVFMVSN